MAEAEHNPAGGARRPDVGLVAIGRNEGERLMRCLRSALECTDRVVYVDSGSADASVANAEGLGVDVVKLDMSIPFTAARSRNSGFARLVERHPDLKYVQFVDGDCEIAPGWLNAAAALLDERNDVAVVCGRRRERDRDATIYNRLCDMEWARPAGVVDACGGDAMIRRSVFEQVKGYDEGFVAGEDPELCVRIRHAGHLVYRLPIDMTLHDAAMTRLSQWWKRTRRAGWAYAAGAARHGAKPGRHNVRGVLRAVWWGVALPLLIVAFLVASVWCLPLLAAAGAAIALYVLLAARIFKWRVSSGDSSGDAALYAFFCALGKPAEGMGVLQYWSQRLTRRRGRIIEYK